MQGDLDLGNYIILIENNMQFDFTITSTCDTEDLQADEGFEEWGSQSAEVIPAEVQQSERW